MGNWREKLSRLFSQKRTIVILVLISSLILAGLISLIINQKKPFVAQEPYPTPPPEGYTYVVPGGSGNQSGTSWNNAYATLQDAFDRFPDTENLGRVILVKEGTYTTNTNLTLGTNNWQKDFAVIGGFRGDEANAVPSLEGETIIDFNASPNDIRHFSINTTSNIVLRHLTFRRGRFNAPSGGGAISVSNVDNIRIISCRFDSNRAVSGGNGAAISLQDVSNLQIKGSHFIENRVIDETSSGGYGGAIYAVGSINKTVTGYISENFFYGNLGRGGGALALRQYTNLRIYNNIFSYNISGSSSRMGGAIYADGDANASIVNHNTFFENMALGHGGTIQLLSQGIDDTSNKLIFRYNLVKDSSKTRSTISRDSLVNFILNEQNNYQAASVFNFGTDWQTWTNNTTEPIFFTDESPGSQSNPLSFRLTNQNQLGAIINNHSRLPSDPTIDYGGASRNDGFPDNGAFEFTGTFDTPTPPPPPPSPSPSPDQGFTPTVSVLPSPSPSPTLSGDHRGTSGGDKGSSKTKGPSGSFGKSGTTKSPTPYDNQISTTTPLFSITPTFTSSFTLPDNQQESSFSWTLIWLMLIILLIIVILTLFLILLGKRRRRREEDKTSQNNL